MPFPGERSGLHAAGRPDSCPGTRPDPDAADARKDSTSSAATSPSLTRKVDALLARSAPVYRGALPGVPALGVPAGTVVLKPEVEGV